MRQSTRDGLLVAAYIALFAVVGFTVGDPGDRTQSACHASLAAGVSGSGSGASTVEPDPDCSQEVGR